MKKIIYSIFMVFPLALLFLTSCGPAPRSSHSGLNILTSTTILADIARNIAGNRAQVTSLVPAGADPHEYQPAPTDVAKISQSTILVLNGLDYEVFIQPLLENAGGQHIIITASDGLTPRQMANESSDGTTTDPHMWLDVSQVVKYVENIRDGFIKADADGASTYTANADAYIAQLKELDSWILEQVSQVPAEKRLLVTNHETFGYFADHYGFTIVGTVIPNVSSDAAPSAQEMAGLIEQIRSTGAPAIFLGEVENPKLAEQIASETGAKVVSDLYLETLTEGAPADTYINMMKHNVTSIVDALK